MKSWSAFLLACVAMSVAAQPPGRAGDRSSRYNASDEEDAPRQQQQEVEPPAFPKQENLVGFYVSAVATNKYFIDASTLAVDAEGVIRYVLVVKTSGGATNVSFEGIRCKDLSWMHYATGHSDGTWTKSRAARIEWRPIENVPVNRHHAALSHDLFCPGGSAIYTADEGRNALRRGKHPNSN